MTPFFSYILYILMIDRDQLFLTNFYLIRKERNYVSESSY